MILVMEAGYQGCVAFSAASTLPVSASTSNWASAFAGDAPGAKNSQAAANPAEPAAMREETHALDPTGAASIKVDDRESITRSDRCTWSQSGPPRPHTARGTAR